MKISEVINLIESVYGESEINCKRKRGSTYITVYTKKDKLMSLVKSYTGGWICLIDYDFVGKGIEPFLVKDNEKEFLDLLESSLDRYDFIRGRKKFKNAV